MKAGSLSRHLSVVAAGLALASTAAHGAVLDLSSTTRTDNGNGTYSYSVWHPILAKPGYAFSTTDGYIYDTSTDQQTGQYDSDFTGTSSVPSFFIANGTIGGTEMIAFRTIFNQYEAKINTGVAGTSNFTSNPVNWRVGLDANLDGKIDIYIGPSFQNNNAQLVYQLPGNSTNTSPSTTSTSTVTNIAQLTSTNFNYQELSSTSAATLFPGWTVQAEGNQTSSDSVMTFALSLSSLNTALAAVGVTGASINSSSFLLFVSFTSTQNNAINQDAYGIDKSSTSTWTSFTEYMNANGRPVPEPSTYGFCLGGALGAFLFLRRRRPASLRLA